jgi:uncharacterized protein YjbI with pentapeptide repeats
VDWTDCEFVGRDFRDDDLSRLRTERVVFTECDFSGVNLAESEHLGSAFRNCTFNLTGLAQKITVAQHFSPVQHAGLGIRAVSYAAADPRRGGLHAGGARG